MHANEAYENVMSGVHQVKASKGEVVVAQHGLKLKNCFGSSTTSLMDIQNAGQYICKSCEIKGTTKTVKFEGHEFLLHNTYWNETMADFENVIGRPVSDFISQDSIDWFNITVRRE